MRAARLRAPSISSPSDRGRAAGSHDGGKIMKRREQRKFRVMLWSASILAIAVSVTTPAWAQYSINWFTIAGGGARLSSGGSYTLGGTIGQPIAGMVSGGSYSIASGFWRGGGIATGVAGPGREP